MSESWPTPIFALFYNPKSGCLSEDDREEWKSLAKLIKKNKVKVQIMAVNMSKTGKDLEIKSLPTYRLYRSYKKE